MKKETKARILATVILMPVYGAICYALYSLDVMSKDSAIGCFIAASTAEPILYLIRKATRHRPLWSFLKTRTRHEAFNKNRPYSGFEPLKPYI